MEDFEANKEIEHDLDLPTLPLFSQLNVKTGHSEEWRETSRWVKFQEDVEDEGKRWSKPFVPSIQLAAILDLKQCFNSGIVAFDVRGYSIVDILGKYVLSTTDGHKPGIIYKMPFWAGHVTFNCYLLTRS